MEHDELMEHCIQAHQLHPETRLRGKALYKWHADDHFFGNGKPDLHIHEVKDWEQR